MKQSEKIIIAVAVVLVAGYGYVQYLHPSLFPAKTQSTVVTKIPDPVPVEVPEFEQQAVDPIPELTPNASQLMGLEHKLLLSGYEAKIAENVKSVKLGDLEVKKGEAELSQLSAGNIQPPHTAFSQRLPSELNHAEAPKKEAATSVIVNKFNSNGTAIVTINGSIYTVTTGSVIAGVKFTAIDALRKKVRIDSGGTTSEIVFSPSATRSITTVEKLSKADAVTL